MVTPTVVVFGYGELGIAAAQALTDAGARIVALVVPSNRSAVITQNAARSTSRASRIGSLQAMRAAATRSASTRYGPVSLSQA